MPTALILKGLHTSTAALQDLCIAGGVICTPGTAGTHITTIGFENAIAFPGLINSHDHLDYNSFPQLGNRIYEDYMAWGEDLHRQYGDIVQAVLHIPKALRAQWGLYKNLLNGITTVVQHGEQFPQPENMIRIFQDYHFLHSIQQEKRWKLRLNKPRKDNYPFVIHIGEGTNAKAAAEIDQLIRWNMLNKKLIGVHGVAMNTLQAKHFRALVWSPDTNLFLLGKTADVLNIKKVIPILFGTDSTLTGHWSIWEQLRIAAQTGQATVPELYDMVTASAAQVWNLPHTGSLETGAAADIVIAQKKKNISFDEAFIHTRPEDIQLVMHRGEILLFDESLYEQLKSIIQANTFSRIAVGGSSKYVIGDLPALMHKMHSYYPGLVFPDVSIP